MALRIVLPNVLELRRLPERRHVPVQAAQPRVDGGIARADVAQVGLEVLHVDRVEADNRCEEADVGFGGSRAEVVGGLLGEVGFDAVEGGEEGG